MSLEKIWKNRKLIMEGIKNNVFKTDAVEAIADVRREICETCPSYDTKGDDCEIPGTAPCCSECGCSMALKLRSLSSECDLGNWTAVLTEEEEDTHESLNTEDDD